MLGVIAAAGGLADKLGGLFAKHHPHTDAEYLARAQQLAAAVRAGNVEAGQKLHWGILRDHQTYGWGQYAQVWNTVASEPAAVAAVARGDIPDDFGAVSLTPTLGDVLSQFGQNVKQDAASAAQTILAGASNKVTDALAPQQGRVTIPTDRNTLLVAGAALVALLVIVAVLVRR